MTSQLIQKINFLADATVNHCPHRAPHVHTHTAQTEFHTSSHTAQTEFHTSSHTAQTELHTSSHTTQTELHTSAHTTQKELHTSSHTTQTELHTHRADRAPLVHTHTHVFKVNGNIAKLFIVRKASVVYCILRGTGGFGACYCTCRWAVFMNVTMEPVVSIVMHKHTHSTTHTRLG